MTRQDFRNFALSQSLPRWLPAVLLLAAALLAGPVRADVSLRVEARPISDRIQTFITVSDANGDPVGVVLDASDFVVILDEHTVAIQPSDLAQPPAQDPDQKVSVVFVMDYSGSIDDAEKTAMEDAVITFIGAMKVGDNAAIIKFNDGNAEKVEVVADFTPIDDPALCGTACNIALKTAASTDHIGGGNTNLLDAIEKGINLFLMPPFPLPSGPWAIIMTTDGDDNVSTVSQSTVIADANGSGIPIFAIGIGNIVTHGLKLLTDLANQTGSGDPILAPVPADISAAYATVSLLLNNEYLLTIPSAISDGITDCEPHIMQVTVAGQPLPGSATFSRRDCDTTPDPFSFTNQTGVKPNRAVTSNTVTISGVEVGHSVNITIDKGKYSIGCGSDDTFTSSDGTIINDETVCVRHFTDATFSTARVTTLTVGTASVTFTSTTSAEPPPNRGGGGAMGIAELLAGLVALAARRRRAVKC